MQIQNVNKIAPNPGCKCKFYKNRKTCFSRPGSAKMLI